MARYYYTLLVRETKSDFWQADFGDYDRQVVHDESFERDCLTKVIKTYDDQESINQHIRLLNSALI